MEGRPVKVKGKCTRRIIKSVHVQLGVIFYDDDDDDDDDHDHGHGHGHGHDDDDDGADDDDDDDDGDDDDDDGDDDDDDDDDHDIQVFQVIHQVEIVCTLLKHVTNCIFLPCHQS